MYEAYSLLEGRDNKSLLETLEKLSEDVSDDE